MKGKRICAAAACLLFCATTAFAAAPVDIQRSWCAIPVNTLMEHGIVTGDPNNRFRPDHNITREEAAALMSRLGKQLAKPTPSLPPSPSPSPKPSSMPSGEDTEFAPPSDTPTASMGIESPTPSPSSESWDTPNPSPDVEEPQPSPTETPPVPIVFPDVDSNRWSYDYIQDLVSQGVLNGYPNGTYVPENEMTRAEFSMMIYRWLKTTDGLDCAPSDASIPDIAGSFAEEAIRTLYAKGILKGCPDGTFQPDRSITRGEAAQALYQLSGFLAIAPEVTIPVSRVISVPYISQLYPYGAVVGCEGTSTLMGLKSKGYTLNITLKQFLDAMPKSKTDPAKGFVGSPYVADRTHKTRTTIYPPILAQYANRYGNVSDFSGSSPNELQAEILAGNPVVIYATMRWERPIYRDYLIEGVTQRLLSNNHAVLVCGYDPNLGYYIADPYNINQKNKELHYWKNKEVAERIYNERRHAIVIR